MLLNPNCSESIFRIRIDGLDDKEKEELNNVIKEMEEEQEWYDTYVNEKEIFGIKTIEINGEGPYHHSEEIRTKIYKLKFANKLIIEEDRE